MEYVKTLYSATVLAHNGNEYTATDGDKPLGKFAEIACKQGNSIVCDDGVVIPFHSMVLMVVEKRTETVDKPDAVCGGGGDGKRAVVGTAVVGNAIVGD